MPDAINQAFAEVLRSRRDQAKKRSEDLREFADEARREAEEAETEFRKWDEALKLELKEPPGLEPADARTTSRSSGSGHRPSFSAETRTKADMFRQAFREGPTTQADLFKRLTPMVSERYFYLLLYTHRKTGEIKELEDGKLMWNAI
jgi:hypothetical protein